MDAAQESKGTTENAEDSDDPDSSNPHHSNEKRKGRFLIEEIEEENQINNEHNNSELLIENELRSHSLYVKKYNLVINTIEYFGEVQDESTNPARNYLRCYIFDNKTNCFVPSEDILTKIINPKILYNYVYLYPHVYCLDDCVDCYNQHKCNCYHKIKDEIMPLDDRKIELKTVEKSYSTVLNKENKDEIIEEIKDKDNQEIKNLLTVEDKIIEVDKITNKSEKLLKYSKFDKNKLSYSLYSNNSFKNEYQLLSVPVQKETVKSPHSCKVHSGKTFKIKYKRYNSSEINFSFVNLKEDKNFKNFFSPNLKPISKFKERTQSNTQINPLLTKAYRSAASAKNIKFNRNSSKFKFKSNENVMKKKFITTKNFMSKRHYSADFPGILSDENKKKELKIDENGKNFPLFIYKENFGISSSKLQQADCQTFFQMGSKIFDTKDNLKIDNNISLSYINSDKICARCSNK